MKKITLSLVAFIIGGSIALISCNNQNETKALVAGTNVTVDSMVKRGEYLVNIMGCDDCHSPKKMGPQGPELDIERRFSGHPSSMPIGSVDQAGMKDWVYFNHSLTAAAGPWGVSYAANLTSDETGIGNWSEQQFIKSMREGKLKGMDNTRPLLPPMPWQNFAKASDEDLKAIYHFLKSTKPVNNVVPAPVAPTGLASLNK